MKKLLLFIATLLLSLPMLAGLHSYAEHSVLANGHWVKIRVSESGVCRMSFSELRSAGIEPQQVRVFGYGGGQLDQDFKQPKIDDLPQVPVFMGEDYILFWVQGPISWTYDGNRFAHTRNTYSDFGYYLLTDDAGSMLAPTESEAISGTATDVSSYIFYDVHDKDSLNLVDRSGVAGGGRTFYGEQFNANQSRSLTFSTPCVRYSNRTGATRKRLPGKAKSSLTPSGRS